MIGVTKVISVGTYNSRVITIPKDIAEAWGIKAGDRLVVELKNDIVTLKKDEE
ncbi:AbrB/MazE/SpoVT family DNA-binding domain-containing protein [bacterium]|nr:AbrB/MazE/SpoVT family DNA-binding domain-containing protein [bacterium]